MERHHDPRTRTVCGLPQITQYVSFMYLLLRTKYLRSCGELPTFTIFVYSTYVFFSFTFIKRKVFERAILKI